MPDLNDYLKPSDLEPFYLNARADDSFNEEWRKQYHADLARIIHPPLIAFFKALKEEGRLAVIPNSDGYACRVWNIWNAAARLDRAAPSDEQDKVLGALAELFAHGLAFPMVYPYEVVLKNEGAAAAAAFDKRAVFDKVVSRFNVGTDPVHLTHENCWNTDLPLLLELAEWVPQGLGFAERTFSPVPPLAPATMRETVVQFKTGNLLVADWFRITEFTNLVSYKNLHEKISINSRKGREEQTDYLTTQFGVVSVCVGNTCPGVYQAGNTIVVGSYDEDEGGLPARFSAVGKVCTDLWAATFVEYEVLVALVSRHLLSRNFPDTAKQIVDDYLAEEDCGTYGIHRLTVEPGTYYLYHFGDHEEFVKMAASAGLKLETGAVQPYFVLSKERLLATTAS